MTAKIGGCVSIDGDPNAQLLTVSNKCLCANSACYILPFSNFNDSEFYELFYSFEYNTLD